MKSFKDILGETVNPIKSPDEKRFADKHVVDKKEHPVATKTQFVSDRKKDASKKASYKPGEDEAVYEEDGKMSKAQLKKREEVVKSMKKKQADFKEKYGENSKNVMYATATKIAMKENSQLFEDVAADLKKIVSNKQAQEVKFADGNKLRVDMQTANVLLKVHDALNDTNKKKFAEAINKNENMFMKMVDFAFSKVK